MKNLNEKLSLEQKNEKAQSFESLFQPSFQVSVYREMSEPTSQSIDVIQMIQHQFLELNKISVKKSFLLKEISQYLK